MTLNYIALLMVLVGYLCGSLNSAIIVCKCMGLPSPRSVGSGNPGATNVLRLGSKPAAAITLIGDVIKGVIPVVIGHLLHLEPIYLACIALAAVLGHLWPLFFGFKGGKGVATTIGVLLALNIWMGLAVVVTWLIIAALFRYSSLASLVATVLSPVYAYFLFNHDTWPPLTVMALLVIIRHQANIARLLHGTESKIGKKVKQ